MESSTYSDGPTTPPSSYRTETVNARGVLSPSGSVLIASFNASSNERVADRPVYVSATVYPPKGWRSRKSTTHFQRRGCCVGRSCVRVSGAGTPRPGHHFASHWAEGESFAARKLVAGRGPVAPRRRSGSLVATSNRARQVKQFFERQASQLIRASATAPPSARAGRPSVPERSGRRTASPAAALPGLGGCTADQGVRNPLT